MTTKRKTKTKKKIPLLKDFIVETLKKENETKFSHDRTETIGASEVGKCLRMVAMSKTKTEKDKGSTELSGFAERGNVMEDHFSGPRVRQWLEANGGQVFFDGQENQITLIDNDKGISATPDGLATGLPRNLLTRYGIKKFSGTLLIEQKSFDPRKTGIQKEPEIPHIFQTIQGMGLMGQANVIEQQKSGKKLKTGWKRRLKRLGLPSDTPPPDAAIIVYTNASDYTDIITYAVPYAAESFKSGLSRAHTIYDAIERLGPEKAVEAMPPEGKMTNECRNCDYKERCHGFAGMVPEKANDIDGELWTEIKTLAARHEAQKKAESDAKKEKTELAGKLRLKMNEANTNFLDKDGVKLFWKRTPGRSSFMREEAEATLQAAGYDPADFVKEGSPGESLEIKLDG